jgi:hypothetical protein
MPDTRENDDENPFRPVWETDDELDPPGRPRAQKRAAEPDYDHPLLNVME